MKEIFLKDYLPPRFLVESVDLTFDIFETGTDVTSHLVCAANPAASDQPLALTLYGAELELKSLQIDGQEVEKGAYTLVDETLTLSNVPESFTLTCITHIKPHENTALEGLYKSSGNYCTQCESEGFRRMTFYPDRPDVMSVFTTKVIADKQSSPVLLSNGNKIEEGELDGGRHFATWHDPFKKPAHLFALVAGTLEYIEDTFTTQSGRDVTLRVYVEPRNINKTAHAMESLKKSMKWDEEAYGREYDLDIFMIVAVDDFNMGAMENKGLNVFNSSCALANPKTATDDAFKRIEGIVAHEYFHNWSGNRVNCRDWFQLSLKEGFTVFRDQSFSGDMWSDVVQRIEDVSYLRTHQFAEDAGPMAHPVQPQSFIEISNFYTLTVYEKGSELVRMIHTLLGPERFRKGSDIYFSKYDGQAVTIEEFVSSMEEGSGVDLTQFRRWYVQAGTPTVHAHGHYDAAAQTYTLSLKQELPQTPDKTVKKAQHIPVKLGLVGADGADMTLQTDDPAFDSITQVISLREMEQTVTFTGVSEAPTPSLLRGFSAPVKLVAPYTLEDHLFLMAHDDDGFNRWNAAQQAAVLLMQEAYASSEDIALDGRYINALRSTLCEESLDRNIRAQMLTLPSVDYFFDNIGQEGADIARVARVRQEMKRIIAHALEDDVLAAYHANCEEGDYALTKKQVGKRALKNVCLSYLLECEGYTDIASTQFNDADNMTDQSAALVCLVNGDDDEAKEEALKTFYETWKDDPQVVDTWLRIQATSSAENVFSTVKALTEHEAFTFKNPNKVRAVISAFSTGNALGFHNNYEETYSWLGDVVMKLDGINPMIASRLTGPLLKWKKYDAARSQHMKAQLERLVKQELSKDTYEVVSKGLAA